MQVQTRSTPILPWAVGVFAATCFLFLPILNNEFVNWGDEAELLRNPHYRGFSPDRLYWMFTTIHMGHYQPLSWITFAVDHLFWGMNPRGYHLTSLLLHAACAVAVFILIRRLLLLARGASPASMTFVHLSALVGALLFALHPQRVESVAWATERRGPLSGLFFVLAIVLYLRYVEQRKHALRSHGALRLPSRDRSAGLSAYWAAVLCFLCSLLAKEFGVSLPIVLLVLDAYPLRRLRTSRHALSRFARLFLEKLPFVFLSAAWSLIAMASSRQSNVAVPLEALGPVSRVVLAFHNLFFTLRKTCWPVDLSPIYELRLPFEPTATRNLLYVAVILTGTLVLCAMRRRWPAALAAWICFVVILLPVLGLIQTGRQFAADRYTYLPSIGVCVVIAAICRWMLHRATTRSAIARCVLVTVLAAGMLAPLMVLTRRQCDVWRSSESLWQHALRLDPESYVANANAGLMYHARGETRRAIELTEESLRINPKNLEAYNNLGALLAESGRIHEAMRRWQQAIEINPRYIEAHINLATAYAQLGRYDEAIRQWETVLKLNPNNARAKAGIQQARQMMRD